MFFGTTRYKVTGLRCYEHFPSPLEVLFFCFSFVRGNAKYTRGPSPDRIFMYGIQMINKFSLVWNKPIRNTFSNHVISQRATFKF